MERIKEICRSTFTDLKDQEAVWPMRCGAAAGARQARVRVPDGIRRDSTCGVDSDSVLRGVPLLSTLSPFVLSVSYDMGFWGVTRGVLHGVFLPLGVGETGETDKTEPCAVPLGQVTGCSVRFAPSPRCAALDRWPDSARGTSVHTGKGATRGRRKAVVEQRSQRAFYRE